NDADLAAHARSDGGDLVFGDPAAPYDDEIVSYSNGSLEAWVRIPHIDAAPATTTFDFSYGDALHAPTPGAGWQSPVVAAWHVSDTDLMVRDSAIAAHNLVAANVTGTWTPPSSVQGVVGGARHFDGTGQIMCGADADGSLEFDLASLSWSEWVRVDP